MSFTKQYVSTVVITPLGYIVYAYISTTRGSALTVNGTI
jgi:hypothetical protein